MERRKHKDTRNASGKGVNWQFTTEEKKKKTKKTLSAILELTGY
jgi:hypothetical protein